ncbi:MULTISPECIES: AAA family ATPase [unclassified Hyphomonas]|uniref:AAA family ATPase n=1 Tax=unclassified Hyphomonas TaxID=2630699 RepID=UPI000C5E2369|nr:MULTISPECIES: MoxR family ATPase [unclassified Hyphomonas]MAA82454.1 AAA family ATPase [Hyphomonas sp.]MAN89854.1 AAA family ATPase [Hyphomonadaceae bacterium]|tara:strand:- start:182817 stop:183815 length:999 start_codon:yes stop_codon:yes gene_type:complete
MADTDQVSDAIIAEAESAAETLAQVKAEIAKAVFGQDRVVELALAAVLAGGHALLIGAPGLAKTRLVEAMGTALGLANQRIQFTPDLMPSDIIGSEVLDESPSGQRTFRFLKGPIFTQLLMADEINRASPRTQSALLQSMQERHVTVAGVRHDLPAPFHVLATQNPIEQEGTYPLPEAQLDRFLLKVDVNYPDLDTERRILIETTTGDDDVVRPALDADRLIALQGLVRRMPVGEKIVSAILGLVRDARPEQTSDERVRRLVDWGPSPRAGQALMLAARSRALLRGRLAPSIEDVEALAEPCLGHRMAMRYDPTGEAPSLTDLINDLARKVS